MDKLETVYIAKACQQSPKCLAWSRRLNLIAYASAKDICIAFPETVGKGAHVISTLASHSSLTTCLDFLSWYSSSSGAANIDYIVSGCGHGDANLLKIELGASGITISPVIWRTCVEIGKDSKKPVSCCAGVVVDSVDKKSFVIAYGGPEGELMIEKVSDSGTGLSVCSVSFAPAFVVSVALHIFSERDVMLVVGTTSSYIQILSLDPLTMQQPEEKLKFDALGSWNCSLAIQVYDGDVLLAAGGELQEAQSEESVVRVWRFTANTDKKLISEDAIKLKEHKYTPSFAGDNSAQLKWVVTLETVLSAHTDWIYSLCWHPQKIQLLSASFDRTVAVWEPCESTGGLWIDKARLGDVVEEAVGFFGAIFSLDGKTIVAYTYRGAFYAWRKDQEIEDDTAWDSIPLFGGHFGPVKDITWDPTGTYLLSCSFDETTRCFAHCRSRNLFAEIARPQIHGYSMNCITSLSSRFFVSGADEKILRAFQAPKPFASSLHEITGVDLEKLFPNFAELPSNTVRILPLSLSARSDNDNEDVVTAPSSAENCGFLESETTANVMPTEEHLSNYTLWPEEQKLYSHGFEVYAVACNHLGTIIASSSKASNVATAVIIIWETATWRARCQLPCHKLTVVQLSFSSNDQFLLSVSRDRTFSIFKSISKDHYDWTLLLNSSQYGNFHTRIIWCCTWSPDDKFFITGSRDKKLCLWRFDTESIRLSTQAVKEAAITAVDFIPEVINEKYIIAVGCEDGFLSIYHWINNSEELRLRQCICIHSQCITRLRFRPKRGFWADGCLKESAYQLASSGDDNAVKVHLVPVQ